MSVQTTNIHTSSGGGFAFRNLRIGPKIIAGYLLLILLMAGVAGVAYWGMTRIETLDELALEHQVNIADLWAMEAYTLEQATQPAHLIINNDSAAIEEFDASAEAMDEKMELVLVFSTMLKCSQCLSGHFQQ